MNDQFDRLGTQLALTTNGIHGAVKGARRIKNPGQAWILHTKLDALEAAARRLREALPRLPDANS